HDTVDKVNAGFATEVTRAAVAAVAFMAYPAHSPPTPTPGPETNMELILNQTQFTPGDFFRLDVAYWNQSVEAVDAVMAVILEIDGRFWFYPSWSGSVDYQPMYFPADLDRSEETIVEFVWPESTLHNDNARFWGFLMTPDLSAVIGEVDQIMWRF
ncbi:hypothetical protein JW979_01485, partial [bacterium]|nr:hypothetical protein [candidate division CSSED10-310 bacterium]